MGSHSLRRWALLALLLALAACGDRDTESIKLGLVVELTGDIPAVGASSRNAAEMAVDEINRSGGISADGQMRRVRLIVEDNANQADQSAAAVQRLMERGDVLAIVGPNASLGAVPAAAVAEAGGTVLMSPWSTNPKTTRDARTGEPKHCVFRACYTDEFEGHVLARFVRDNLKLDRVAILYDVASEAPKSQAELFKKSFTAAGGTVAAMETYTSGDRDFSAQLTKIKAASPQLIFLPAYYNDVPLVVTQAKRLGLAVPFLGSDAWSSPELIALSQGAVEGFYFANHYAVDAQDTVVQNFVAAYRTRYGQAPDDVAALTYDAVYLMRRAIETAGRRDRKALREAVAGIRDFSGVTGCMEFTPGSGDPRKSAVILKIAGDKFKWFATVNP